MEYEISELLPLVSELARKYTAGDSTSITWERAEQLMEAVLYCIREMEQGDASLLSNGIFFVKTQEQTMVLPADGKLSARQAYRAGVARVKEKTRQALALYHAVLPDFRSYGNECLEDTVLKGIPEFFKWYDVDFAPQETILTLDYPVLADLTAYCGIDRIYGFLSCIRLEQVFLKGFPEGAVEEMLRHYDPDYREMVDNLCEGVLSELLARYFRETGAGGKACRERAFSREIAQKILERMIKERYDGNIELRSYLTPAAENAAARLLNTGTA